MTGIISYFYSVWISYFEPSGKEKEKKRKKSGPPEFRPRVALRLRPLGALGDRAPPKKKCGAKKQQLLIAELSWRAGERRSDQVCSPAALDFSP